MFEARKQLRRTGAALAAIVALCLFGAAHLSGCSSQPIERVTSQAGADKREALTSLAEGHHKRADIALRQGQPAEAITEIETLIQTAEPHRGLTDGGYDVTFDAAARLARIHLDAGDLIKAEAAARRGLQGADSAPPSLFLGYLHQMLAEILEQKKDLRGAVDEHGRAIEIFKAILDKGPSPTPSGAPNPAGQ